MWDFYVRRLRFVHQINVQWLQFVLNDEDDRFPEEVMQRCSELLNLQHIWLTQLKHISSDVEWNDRMPQHAWLELEQDNQQSIQQLLDEYEHDFETVEPAFFRLLQQLLNWHGKLEELFQQLQLPLPTLQLVID